MKKIAIIVSSVLVVILLVLFLPIPGGAYDDGGSREYNALTYKIVVWSRGYGVELDGENPRSIHGTYQKTCVYWYPENRKSTDELWEKEFREIIRELY